MKTTLRIGNAQGFWGDSAGAPARLIQQQPDLDYLTLDYLAEVSLSIMAIQREKKPTAGYASDFIDVVRSLIPIWHQGSSLKIVTNAGGLNPLGCAKACQEILRECPRPMRIGVVSGDDVYSIFKATPENFLFRNLETQVPLTTVVDSLVTANAYLGAKPMAEALIAGADIVITGRVADPSLTVAPCVAHFGWSWDEYDKLAGATIAGHLIECGTQVTGGISTNWLDIPDPAHIGFPVVEMQSDGSFIVTKPKDTGGRVNFETVKEQLLYEIGDPSHYLSPDVTVSFLSLRLEQEGLDRIFVSGAKGAAPPPTYKVSATYRDGFKAEGMIVIFGPDAGRKAHLCGEMILERVRKAGYKIPNANIECIGDGAVVPGVLTRSSSMPLSECVLRICIADAQQAALECFSKELASLVTCGSQGVTGYSSGRPKIRPVFGYWPSLIDRQHVIPKVQFLESSP